MAAASVNAADVASMLQAGVGVFQLLRKGVTPRQLRDAGLSFAEMDKHMGVHLLIQAGFEAEDFVAHGRSLESLAPHFPLPVLKASAKFPVREFLHCRAVPLSSIKGLGFSAEEVVQALEREVSRGQLAAMGFSEAEIASAKAATAQAVVTGEMQPSPEQIVDIQPGRPLWRKERRVPSELRVEYGRVLPAEARELLGAPHPDAIRPGRSSGYSYDGSGRFCPRCGGYFVLLDKYTSSDGMCGVERGRWVCEDPECGFVKTEAAETYGTIF